MPPCRREPADPLAWTPERSDDLTRRAAAGASLVLFERSPGGAVATAARVNRYRPARRAGGEVGRREPRSARSAGVPRERRPARRAGARRRRVRGRADPDPGRDGPEPARDEGRRGAQRALHPPAGAPRLVRRAARPGAGRRALRSRRRRWPGRRATSRWPRSASAARTSRSSPTTWAWATSRA